MAEKKHDHSQIGSNNHECFSTFIGCEVTGVLFNTFPLGRADLASGTKTLIFKCGWALTIKSNGSYWLESPNEVKRGVQQVRDALTRSQKEIKQVLALAGE